MCQAFQVLLSLTISLLCLALAGNISALLGTSWMEVDIIEGGVQTRSLEIGLLRFCDEWWHYPRNVSCGLNLHLFKFNTNKEWDITAILMIISSGFIFFAIISALTMMCSQTRRQWWIRGAIITSVFTLTGAIASLAALVYFEVEWYGRIHVINYDRGWSNIVGWATSGIGLGTFAFSCTLTCVKPFPEGSLSHSPTAPDDNNYPMSNMGSRNHGYQDRNVSNKNKSYNGVIKEFYATQGNT